MSAKLTTVFLAGVLTLLLDSCIHDPFEPFVPPGTSTGPCDPNTVYFERDLLPLFRGSCALSGCHSASSAEEGVVLDSYAHVMTTAGVKPGNARGSELYKAVTHGAEERMPPAPASPLSDAQVTLIREWIDKGARDLRCDGMDLPCDTTHVSYANSVVPILQNNGCITCHSGGNAVLLNTYSAVRESALNGRLYGSINHDPQYVSMPQGGAKLGACYIATVRIWIEAGAPDN